jgi:hypothetical protein
LNRILDETSGENLPIELRMEHQFVQLLLGSGEDREALGTIQDAATHGMTHIPCETQLPTHSQNIPCCWWKPAALQKIQLESTTMSCGWPSYYPQAFHECLRRREQLLIQKMVAHVVQEVDTCIVNVDKTLDVKVVCEWHMPSMVTTCLSGHALACGLPHHKL